MTVAAVIAVCVKITAVINAVRETVDAATELVISVRKFVDAFGNVSTEIYYKYDSDGDGEADAEKVIYNIESYIPDLNEPFQLVDKNGTIGLGYPMLRTVDYSDVSTGFLDSEYHSSTSGGYRFALEGDGTLDDVVYPLPFDFTGDGLADFQIIVDDNDNGLPDYCPTSPFYPIGSEGYEEILLQYDKTDYTIMDKPISKYTVTEGLLLLFAIVGAFKLIGKAFRRKKVV